MITRKINKDDSRIGFVSGWIDEIAKHVHTLYILCWQKSDARELPKNVHIINISQKNIIVKILDFEKKVFVYVSKVDGLFCHMNPEYTILAAPIFRIFRKKVVSWYMHKQVTWKLRLLEKFANSILTASKESFRLPSKKVIVTGHGIDVKKFTPVEKISHTSNKFTIVTVGRISPTKDYESLIKAVAILKKKWHNTMRVEIVGAPGLARQYSYLESLKQMVKASDLQDIITFVGPVKHKEVIQYYQKADIFVNLSNTGSLDKAVLEAMACGNLVLTSNEAFFDVLDKQFIVPQNKPDVLAQKIIALLHISDKDKKNVRVHLRDIVVTHHSLNTLAPKIIKQFS